MISIGIIGASGYTGGELLKLLAEHPSADVRHITSERFAGQQVGNHFPGLNRYRNLKFMLLQDSDLPDLDLFFMCLPHGKSMATVKKLVGGRAKIIDFSADFRLENVAEFESWYKQDHVAPELCAEAAYGLPEIYRDKITSAKLVANPGCYPTSILLPLIPLFRDGIQIRQPLIVDSKSGVSGAGRNPGLAGHFVEANGNFSAYKIGRSHRHIPEIEEKLNQFAGDSLRIIFTPHLLPVNRGILSTIYLNLTQESTQEKLRSILNHFYAEEPFVNVLEDNAFPQLTHVRHSNRCDIGIKLLDDKKTAVIVSCIDNLVKGASGQAIQNMNLLFNLPETSGLPREGVIG